MDVDVNKAAEALSTSTVINGDRLEALMKKLLLGGNIVVNMRTKRARDSRMYSIRTSDDEVFCGNVQDMFVLCVHVIKSKRNSSDEEEKDGCNVDTTACDSSLCNA